MRDLICDANICAGATYIAVYGSYMLNYVDT